MKMKNYLKTSIFCIVLLHVLGGSIWAMPRFYFEKEDPLMTKILAFLFLIGISGFLSAKIIYPQLLEEDVNPFKARVIFNATLFALFVLFFGITFHSTLNSLVFSIVLGIVMLVLMFFAILKK